MHSIPIATTLEAYYTHRSPVYIDTGLAVRQWVDTMQSCCQDNELMPYKHSMQAAAKKMHFPAQQKYQNGRVDVHEHASA